MVTVSDPYAAFGLGELVATRFVLFSDVPTFRETSLTLSAGGTNALGNGGRPEIGQLGSIPVATGVTPATNADVLTFDMGAAAFDNGAQLGRNAILLQSSGAGGSTFDLAIVFDIDAVFEGVSAAFVVSNPNSGSFTFDSAIQAVNNIPEPSAFALVPVGFLAVWRRRRCLSEGYMDI